MARPLTPEIPPINEDPDVDPKHMIIWLDKHIGVAEECVLLKCSLFLAIDPTTGLFERTLNKDDIDRIIRLDATLLVRLDEVEFLFQAFVDVEKCFLAIEKNLKKRRIFFITSGSKGRIIVPRLMSNFSDTFIPNYRMYIFCANTIMRRVDGFPESTNDWVLDFLSNILMLDHQDDLFVRMVVDIAEYFLTEAQRLDTAQQLNSAYQYFVWSKQMFRRYGLMQSKNMTTKIGEIDQCIKDVERRRNPPNDDDENVRVAEPCS